MEDLKAHGEKLDSGGFMRLVVDQEARVLIADESIEKIVKRVIEELKKLGIDKWTLT